MTTTGSQRKQLALYHRKYRILDDCSRLRDIIDSLPQDEDLRFIPSLLVIDWVDSSEGSQAAVDFVTMVSLSLSILHMMFIGQDRRRNLFPTVSSRVYLPSQSPPRCPIRMERWSIF